MPQVKINLLPEKIRDAETMRVIVALGAAALVLPFLFWGWRYTVAKAGLSVLDERIAKVQAELTSPSLIHVVEEVKQFSQDRQELDSKRSVIDILRKKQVYLVRAMDVLPDVMPPKGWAINYELREDKAGKRLFLDVIGSSPDVIASLYANLEAHPFVKDLKIELGPEFMLKGGRQTVKCTLAFALEDAL